MTLASMPDYVWLPVVALIYAVVEVLKAVALKIAARKVETAADRVESKVDTVHLLVNSERGAMLAALAVAMRTIATDRPGPATEAAAERAELVSREHEEQQAKVNARETPNAP